MPSPPTLPPPSTHVCSETNTTTTTATITSPSIPMSRASYWLTRSHEKSSNKHPGRPSSGGIAHHHHLSSNAGLVLQRKQHPVEIITEEKTKDAYGVHRNSVASSGIHHRVHHGGANKCSPYYHGLIDPSIIINRERQLNHLLSSEIQSPGHESHAATIASSSSTSSSLSSFILKIQGWSSSCFSFSFKANNSNNNMFTIDHNKTISNRYNNTSMSETAIAHAPAPATIIIEVNHSNSKKISSSTRPASTSSLATPTGVRIDHSSRSDTLREVNERKPLRERLSISHNVAEIDSDDHHKEDQPSTPSVDMSSCDQMDQFKWATKYRPKALNDFICSRDKALQLQTLVGNVGCSHFIFEGPAGVGKRTMIWAMLQEAFGPDRVQTRDECKAFHLKGEPIGSIKVRLRISYQHVEVNLSDLRGYEKHVIVELIKETHNRIFSQNASNQSQLDTCRAIVLYDADKLSTEVLLYVKWLLEKYKGFSKFFFCCTDVSKLNPIKTLCTIVQLSPPSNEEIEKVLEFIAEEEGLVVPHKLVERIAINSKNNLRQAIRSFEACWQKSYPFTEGQRILTGWEDDIENIAKNMIKDQSPKQLYIIRGKIQKLVEHDVSPGFFFEYLITELKKNLDKSFHQHINRLYNFYNGRDGNMLNGEKSSDLPRKKVNLFMRIEEFIARFMSFYKSVIKQQNQELP